MKDDLFAALDTYATGMQIAIYGWFAALTILHLVGAWLAIAIGRAAFNSIARAIQLCNDIEAEYEQLTATFPNDTRKEQP